MLRWSIVLMSLASSGCVLGGGVDLPSTDIGPAGEPSGEGSDGGFDSGVDVSPPPEASPSGSGGSPCCEDPNLGGASGSGGAGP